MDDVKRVWEADQTEEIYMDSPPFFGIDDHACDPGYEPEPSGSRQIREAAG